MVTRRWRRWSAIALFGAIALGPSTSRAQAPPAPRPALDDAEMTRLLEQVDRAHGAGELGRPDGCVQPAQRLLDLAERSFEPNDPALLAYLDLLGWCALNTSMQVRAEQVFRRALAIASAAIPPRPADTATALRGLGELAQVRGDLAAAEGYLGKALDIRRRALGGDHPAVAEALRDLGSLRVDQGRYAEAVDLHREALRIRESALGPSHADTIASAADLAGLVSKAGGYAEAEQLFRRALAGAEQAQRAGPSDLITRLLVPYVLVGFVAHLADRGRDVEALQHLERATGILEQALGEVREGQGALMTTALAGYAAVIFSKLGDFQRGRQALARYLAAARSTLGPDHPATAMAHRLLGELYLDEGRDLAAAEAQLREALAIQDRSLDPEHPDLGYTLGSLGEVLLARGDFRGAEPFFLRARAVRLHAFGPDHPTVAGMIHHLGEVAESAGDPGRAKVLFEQALALRAGKLGPEHPTVADSYARLARLAAATGRPAEARWAAERAGAIRDRIAPEVLTIGSESQKRAYMTTLIRETDLVVGLSADHPDDPAIVRMALGTVLRRKGLVLEAMADIRATLRRRLGPAEQTIFDRLSALESQLASVSPAGGPVPGAAKLEAERRKLEAELSARSAPFREARRPVTVTEVASHLPEGAALLEVVRYNPYDPRHSVPAERWGPPRYGAYVLRPRGAPAFVALGDAEAIDTAVKRLRSALDDPSLAHDPKPAATAAYRQIFAPIVPQLGGAHTLWVSPDGELNLLPFAALIDPETDRLLLERYTFTYLTSGRDLVRSTEHVEPREAPLVVGAPAYDAIGADWAISTQAARDGDTRGRRSRSLGEHLPVPPLPATLPEALAAAALLPGARVLTGADATEAAIKAVRGPSVLHLATHGFFFEDERADARSAENALLRAGLLFAGANHLKSGEDDGVLTALEANALDLHGTSLVVLSACETGLGSASTGEGVYGLRRALSMAGAETVVMSLWRADDQVTLAVMVGYYQRLARGEGRSEAMRGAQLAMLGQAATAHPHLWASFIVSGRGDAMPSRRAARPTEVHGPPGCACAEARAVGGGTGALWIWSGLGIALLRRATKGRARAGRATS